MLINRIKLKNFGVFQDVDIDFGTKAEGITFINGNNGRGKTTLLDALKWCLYSEGQPKVALRTLQEMQADDIFPVSVEITFDLGSGSTARVSRSQDFRKIDTTNSTSASPAELEVKTTTPDPLDGVRVEANAEAWLQRRLPPRLMNFVLFDGEQMAKFFDLKTKAAIEKAVLEIAGVDSLDAVVRSYTDAKESLERKIARESGSDVENLQAALEKTRSLARVVSEDLASNSRRAKEIEIEIEEIDSIVGGAAPGQIERLKEVERLVAVSIRKKIDAENELFRTVRDLGPIFVLASSFESLHEEVTRAEREGWLPPDFDPKALSQLLEAGTCICGCDLSNGSKHRDQIAKIIEGYSDASEIGKILQETWNQIRVTEGEIKASVAHVKSLRSALGSAQNELQQVRDEQRGLQEDLIGIDQEVISQLSSDRKSLSAEKEDLIRDSVSLNMQAKNLVGELKKREDAVAKARVSNAKTETDERLIALADEVIAAAKAIRESAVNQVRSSLEKAMDTDLNNLKEGQYKVKVTEDFEIHVDLPGGQKPSEGELMLLAYSFAMALRAVLNLEFPLIVDTPFGRIDQMNRNWLSSSLVRLVSRSEEDSSAKQVVFFMHDAEFTPFTKANFEPSEPYLVYLGHDPIKMVTQVEPGIDPSWFEYEGPWKYWQKEQA